MKNQKNIIQVCKSLIIAYFTTAVFLFIFAAVIWKMDISQSIIKAAVLVFYILSAGVGGFYLGKKQREKKFLWGMLLGCLYFLVLVLMTLFSDGFTAISMRDFVTTLIICVMSGTLGGMLA